MVQADEIAFVMILTATITVAAGTTTVAAATITTTNIAHNSNSSKYQQCCRFFERRLWCRHLCPIGGMNGMFAKLSMTELRSRQGVCSGALSLSLSAPAASKLHAQIIRTGLGSGQLTMAVGIGAALLANSTG